MVELTSGKLFEMIGRALCPSNNWQSDLARLMNVRRDTIRNWRTGRRQLRDEHLNELQKLITSEKNKVIKARKELSDWMERNI